MVTRLGGRDKATPRGPVLAVESPEQAAKAAAIEIVA